MSQADPLLDPTGRVEPVNQAIAGGRSLWDDARARLFHNKAAVASMWVLGVLVVIAIIGPMVWVHDYRAISGARACAPGKEERGEPVDPRAGDDATRWNELTKSRESRQLVSTDDDLNLHC